MWKRPTRPGDAESPPITSGTVPRTPTASTEVNIAYADGASPELVGAVSVISRSVTNMLWAPFQGVSTQTYPLAGLGPWLWA
jgi:hypothetical protein